MPRGPIVYTVPSRVRKNPVIVYLSDLDLEKEKYKGAKVIDYEAKMEEYKEEVNRGKREKYVEKVKEKEAARRVPKLKLKSVQKKRNMKSKEEKIYLSIYNELEDAKKRAKEGRPYSDEHIDRISKSIDDLERLEGQEGRAEDLSRKFNKVFDKYYSGLQ